MDAFYQVFITISAVGLTEVHPLVSTPLRLHTMLIIAMGLFSVAYTLGGFISFLTEGEFQKFLGHQRMMKQIETLEKHTIVAGFGRVGAWSARDWPAAELPFVVIELDHERVLDMEPSGFLHMVGDATEEAVLKEAGITRASVLVRPGQRRRQRLHHAHGPRTAPRSADHRPGRAAQHQKKLRQAGANHVVTPAAIGAQPDRLAAHQPHGGRIRGAGDPAIEPGHRDERDPDRRRKVRWPARPCATPTSAA